MKLNSFSVHFPFFTTANNQQINVFLICNNIFFFFFIDQTSERKINHWVILLFCLAIFLTLQSALLTLTSIHLLLITFILFSLLLFYEQKT